MTGVGGGGAVYQCHRLAPPSSAPGNGVKENSTLSTRRVSDNLSNTQLYFRNDYLIQIEYLSPPKTVGEHEQRRPKLCVILLSWKSAHFGRFCNLQAPLLAVKEKSRE